MHKFALSACVLFGLILVLVLASTLVDKALLISGATGIVLSVLAAFVPIGAVVVVTRSFVH